MYMRTRVNVRGERIHMPRINQPGDSSPNKARSFKPSDLPIITVDAFVETENVFVTATSTLGSVCTTSGLAFIEQRRVYRGFENLQAIMLRWYGFSKPIETFDLSTSRWCIGTDASSVETHLFAFQIFKLLVHAQRCCFHAVDAISLGTAKVPGKIMARTHCCTVLVCGDRALTR